MKIDKEEIKQKLEDQFKEMMKKPHLAWKGKVICMAGTFNSGKTTDFKKMVKKLKPVFGENFYSLSERSRYYNEQGIDINEAQTEELTIKFLSDIKDFIVKYKNKDNLLLIEDSPFAMEAYPKFFKRKYFENPVLKSLLDFFLDNISVVWYYKKITPIEDDGVRLVDYKMQNDIEKLVNKYMDKYKDRYNYTVEETDVFSGDQ